MAEESILYGLEDGVATITLNRPDRLNSFNPDMHLALREALARAAKEARAVLLTGAGRGFCAGQDLSDRSVAADEAPMRGELGELTTEDSYWLPLVTPCGSFLGDYTTLGVALLLRNGNGFACRTPRAHKIPGLRLGFRLGKSTLQVLAPECPRSTAG